MERPNRFRSWAFIAFANILSLVCMVWVLKNAGLHSIWGEIRHMSWSWVCFALISDVAVYMFHGWRWRLLLKPLANIPFLQTLQAIYVGLFTNEVFPLRAGELVRCFLLSKASQLPLSVTFASALIERIFDGIWLISLFFYCMRFGHVPKVLMTAGYILAGLIVVLAGVLGSAMYARKQSLDKIFGLSWPGWFNTLIEDLHLIGHSRYLYYSFLVSGLYLAAQMLPIYSLVRANRLAVPWSASLVAMVLLRLSAVVPQAPGNLGSFQWVALRSLMMFGLERGRAARFSLILWAVVTIPLMIVGFVAVTVEGINLSHLQKEAAIAAKEKKQVA